MSVETPKLPDMLKVKVAAVTLTLFGLTQVINHWLMIRMPMPVQHLVAFWMEVGIALFVAGLVYWNLSRYRRELEALNAALTRKNEELQKLNVQKDELTAMIVHDLRNPLTSIISGLQFLEERLEQQNAKDTEFIRIALDGATEMLTMVNSLLDVAKLEAGEMPLHRSRFDLAEAVAQVLELTNWTAEQKQLTFNIVCPDHPVWVEADRELTFRVLSNLLGNAIRFTPFGGQISLWWYPSQTPGWVEVAVQDTGPGIPEGYRKKIFEKFVTVQGRREGVKASTGLGLTFCKLAVEAHGGRIWVESEMGRGSTFFFTLPAASNKEETGSLSPVLQESTPQDGGYQHGGH